MIKLVLSILVILLTSTSLAQDEYINYNKDIWPLLKVGNYDDALPLLEKYTTKYQDQANAFYWLAKIYELKGRDKNDRLLISRAKVNYLKIMQRVTPGDMLVTEKNRWPDVQGIDSEARKTNLDKFLTSKLKELEILSNKILEDEENIKAKEKEKALMEEALANEAKNKKLSEENSIKANANTSSNITNETPWFIGSLFRVHNIETFNGKVKDGAYVLFKVWVYGKEVTLKLDVEYNLIQQTTLGGVKVKNGNEIEEQYRNKFFKVYYSQKQSLDAYDSYGTRKINNENYVSRIEFIKDTVSIVNYNYLPNQKLKVVNFIDNEFIYANGEKFNGFVTIYHPFFLDKNGAPWKYIEGNFENGKATGTIELNCTFLDKVNNNCDQALSEHDTYSIEYYPEGKIKQIKGFYLRYDKESLVNKKTLWHEYNYDLNGMPTIFYTYHLKYDENQRVKYYTELGEAKELKITFKNGFVEKEEGWHKIGKQRSIKIYKLTNSEEANCGCKETHNCKYTFSRKIQQPENSESTKYFDDGIIQEKEIIVNGNKEGKYIENYANGKPKKVYNYVNSKPNGPQTLYWQNGKVNKKEVYKDGVLVKGSFYLYDENGTLKKNY
jgi:hypothetical protein